MNDNIEPPAGQRWRALAKDCYAVAEGTTDEETRRIMRKIAQGYEHMALNAEAREARLRPVMMSEAAPEPGAHGQRN